MSASVGSSVMYEGLVMSQVEDDVVSCHTVQEEVCSDVVSGYTSATKCSSFPRESCALEKVKVAKLSPETGCDKRPVELCAPRGCALVNVSRQKNDFSHPIYLID